MSTSIKIFQIYYKPDQIATLDPDFVPLDNTANLRPELREWYNWDAEYESIAAQKLDYWGFVSWKFKEKTNLTGRNMLDYIKQNPGHDVYLFNPCLINEAVFINSWEQGDIHHPNISNIGNDFLRGIGYDDISVKDVLLDRTRTTYANYIVGNGKFWKKFMSFSRKLFTESETNPELHRQIFGAGGSNYAHDHSLPMFTFLIERLIPTFIELEGFNSFPYVHTFDTVHEKYKPYFAELQVLSKLKVLINEYDSNELFDIWNFYRKRFLQANPTILGLE